MNSSSHYIYLDHAAMTPTSDDVISAMAPYYDATYANPSSLHAPGRRANEALGIARARVARTIGARPREIVFTGSGTQADNLALQGVARASVSHGKHIIVSSIEHKAVLHAAMNLEQQGWEVTYLPVDAYGRVDVAACIAAVRPSTTLVSVMYANNEIGTVQPIADLARALRKHRGTSLFPLLHTDACQAGGALPIDVNNLGVDLMTLNGSKIYGPKGVGMLYVREGVHLEPMIIGGSQEHGLHAGTENLPLIVGFAEALACVEAQRVEETARLTKIRDHFISGLKKSIPGVILNGHPQERLANNVHVTIPDIEGESMVLELDALGVAAATGSACSASDLVPSYVLRAIGQDDMLVHGSLRFTMGAGTTQQDIDYVLEVLPDIVKRLRSLSSLTTSYGFISA